MEPCGEDRSDSPFRGKQGLWGHVSSNSGKVWNSLWRALECCVPAPVWSQSDLGNSIGNSSSNPGGQRDRMFRETCRGRWSSRQIGQEGPRQPTGGNGVVDGETGVIHR